MYCDGATLNVEYGDLDRELLDDAELDIDRQHELVEGIASKLDICHMKSCLSETKRRLSVFQTVQIASKFLLQPIVNKLSHTR